MKIIDADELIKSLTVNQLDCPGCPEPEFLPELIEILKETPEVELPIRSARWELKWEDWRHQLSWLECSHCHARTLEPYNYCPYCGSYSGGEIYNDSVICNTCGYYHPENNTCNVKKCSGYGWGYVTKLDRKYCTSYRKLQENEQKRTK